MTDPPPTLAVTNVEVDGHRVDVVTRDGRVAAITAHGAGRAVGRADEHIDGAGGALLPGLHDHHVHLLATAAAAWSSTSGTSAPATAMCSRRCSAGVPMRSRRTTRCGWSATTSRSWVASTATPLTDSSVRDR